MQQSVCVSVCVTGQLHNGQHKQTQSFQGTPRGTEFPRTSQHWASTIWQKNIQKYKEKKKFKLKGGDSKADVSTNMRLLKKHFWIHCVYLINSYLRQKQNKIPCSGFSLRLWKETINKKHYYYMFLKNTVRSNTCWSMKRFTTPKKYAHTLGVMSTFQNESMFICEKVDFFKFLF